MSNQDIGRTGTEERPYEQPEVVEEPQSATPVSPEQPLWQPAPPPQYPPYARQNYYPGPGQQPYYGPYYGPPYAPPPRRRHSAWPWIVLAILLVMVFTWLGGVAFNIGGLNLGAFTNTVTETPQHFTVGANPTVVINNDIGTIQVQSGAAGSGVTIQATKHAGFGSNISDVQVSYSQNSSANTITVNVDRTANTSFISSPGVDFAVTVPNHASLELKTNTGSLDVNGVSGRISAHSNTGSVQVVNGALSPDSILNSNTGSITFNGSISQTGSYQFTTNTGSINVTLPSSSTFHLDASTDTGSITSDFPGVNVQHPNFTGAVAHSDVGSSPQATVTMRTNTGSINLHQS